MNTLNNQDDMVKVRLEKNRLAQKKFYKAHGDEKNRARTIKRLKEGSKVSKATLDKYNIPFSDAREINPNLRIVQDEIPSVKALAAKLNEAQEKKGCTKKQLLYL